MFDWLHPGAGIHGDEAGFALTFVQEVRIDLTLAGDNAIAVGLAASSLSDPVKQRRVIFWGIGGAVVLRILLALAAVRLLQIHGLLLAGGGLLLWVGWRLAWDLRERARHDAIPRHIDRALAADPDGPAALAAATARPIKPRSLLSVILLVLITDVSVSLDNVLAVAGAAHTRALDRALGRVLRRGARPRRLGLSPGAAALARGPERLERPTPAQSARRHGLEYSQDLSGRTGGGGRAGDADPGL